MSSGSNFSGIGEDKISEHCDIFIHNRIPIYSIVDFTDEKLTVSTYKVEQNELIDEIAIVKD